MWGGAETLCSCFPREQSTQGHAQGHADPWIRPASGPERPQEQGVTALSLPVPDALLSVLKMSKKVEATSTLEDGPAFVRRGGRFRKSECVFEEQQHLGLSQGPRTPGAC